MATDHKEKLTISETAANSDKGEPGAGSAKGSSDDFELTDNFCKKGLSKADLKKQ